VADPTDPDSRPTAVSHPAGPARVSAVRDRSPRGAADCSRSVRARPLYLTTRNTRSKRHETGYPYTRKRADQALPPEPEIEVKGNGLAEEESLDDYVIADDGAARGLDDFDNLDDFALEQNFNPGAVEVDQPISCRRPGPYDYFRVNPDPAMTKTMGFIELPDERDDLYIVKKNMATIFGSRVSLRQVFVYQTASGKLALWACKLPRTESGGRRSGGDKYNKTALKAADMAKSEWVMILSDQDEKCYRIFTPPSGSKVVEPDWTKCPPFNELLRRAFGDGHVVKDNNHPLVRRLQSPGA
jgi:hypothetical protein